MLIRIGATTCIGVAYAPADEGQSGSPLNIDGAADLFAKLGLTTEPEDAEKPSEGQEVSDKATEPTKGTEQDDVTEGAEDDESTDPQEPDQGEPDDATKADEPARATDEALVTISVDGKDHEIAVRDLKRLWGQEAALTRKSQELAAKRQEFETTSQKTAIVLDRTLTKAKERWAEFEGMDFISLGTKMDPEAFAELRRDALDAWNQLQFIQKDADEFLAGLKERQKAEWAEALKTAKEQLADPDTGIPNWSEAVYNDLRSYAVTQGIAQDQVDSLIDPVALRLLWKAKQFDDRQKAVAVKVRPKIAAAPKKVIRSGTEAPAADDQSAKRQELMSRLRKSGGKIDQAAALFDSL